MGGSSTPSNTTSKTIPWGPQREQLKFLFGEARDLYGQAGPNFFPGQTFAGFDPATTQAQEYGLNFINNGFQSGVYNPTQQAFRSALDAPDLSKNQYLQPAISAAIDPITKQFTEKVLPSIRGGAIGSGQLGGSREGIATSLSVQDYLNQTGNIASSMANTAYGQGLQARSAAMGMAPQLAQLGLMPMTIGDIIGQQRQALAQKRIDEERQRFEFGEMQPYEKLRAFQGFVGGSNFGSSTQSSGFSGGGASPWLQGAGAAASLAALLASLGG